MPRRNSSEAGSAFHQLQRQARTLLTAIRHQIRAKESNLKRLKEEESKLGAVTGAMPAHGRTASERINWRAVLEQLPQQFKASDIGLVKGLKHKRSAEIFAVVTRWIEAGRVKRKARGLYERTGN